VGAKIGDRFERGNANKFEGSGHKVRRSSLRDA
jgi:hypothetical protein